MFLEILSFIHGIISNVIDYMYDSKLFLEYKKVFELLFIAITIFFFLSNKYISFFGSGLFVCGGFAGMLFAPHAVDAFIWKSVIYLSIPVFIYHLVNLSSLTRELSSEEINQFLFKVMPIVGGALLLALLEDYLVPEEYGNKKLYDKFFQLIVLSNFLYILNYSYYFKELTQTNKLILNLFTLAWLGNIVSGVYILSCLSHLFVKEEITVL
jgi:hypothetical protein